ncbi:uncharacterized protein E6C27_scaffold96G002450 [Cucumis melo var. makuwa]|uniref:Uncharacterized protein n=2 Tax=Cucumis melo TaxID=3656 RepID=A0A5A7UQZ2_CUCMM|nr:uncharacterized protein E6C27_scaffold96G002450 [Cucumis melo var. makuwa]
MEGQQVFENFDSLWFFSTVFSNRTPPVVEKPIQNDFVEPLGEEIATPITRNEENDVGEEKEMETEEMEEKRRKNRGRRSWGLEQRRKFVVGEIDLSYAVKEICECWSFEVMRIGGGKKTKKMPSFEDSMAMKEHIRSWAYAVACTVR